jgi:hypothetical protein
MFASPEKPFLLPHYAEVMACALATSMPTSLPPPRILGDPRILNFINMFVTKDFAITLSSSYFEDEVSPDSCHSSSESSFYSRKVSIDQSGSSGCSSSLSKRCNNGSTS